MKNIKGYIITLLIGVLVLAGCGGTETDGSAGSNKDDQGTQVEQGSDEDKQPQQNKISKEAIAVVESNLKNSETEDIDAYLKDLTTEVANSDGVKDSVQNVFDSYDLDYELLDVTTFDETEDKVYVMAKQQSVAKGTTGNYTDNITVAVHVLVKEDGEFKMSQTSVIDSMPLSAEQSQGDVDQEEILQQATELIERNLTNSENEDLDAYLEDVVSNVANSEEAKNTIKQTFDTYDLSYELVDISIFDATPNKVYAIVKQKNVAKEGSTNYQDNLATAVHTLVKEDGVFKLQKTVLVDSEPLK